MLQLMLSGGLSTILPCSLGLVSGALYCANFLSVRQLSIPRPVAAFAARTLGQFSSVSSKPTIRVARRPRSHTSAGARAAGPDPRAAAADEASISRLEEMGFTRSQAAGALQSTGNHVDNALALLLSS